ncbi:hypothetical protein ACFQH6_10680 [Halobacteriaceae archaeon GCM10025711]
MPPKTTYTDTENTGFPAVPDLTRRTDSRRTTREKEREELEEVVWSHRLGEAGG